MGIPQGETPIPSSLLPSVPAPVPSGSPFMTTSMSGNGTLPSATRSVPPQQSTAGASSLGKNSRVHLELVLAVSGLALMGATLMVL